MYNPSTILKTKINISISLGIQIIILLTIIELIQYPLYIRVLLMFATSIILFFVITKTQLSFLKKNFNYFVYYKDFSLTKRQAFNEGIGIYFNLALKTKFLTLMVSYWQGERYIAEYGGKLYQSVSSKKQGEDERLRQLLFLRFMHDVKITDNIFLVFRFEPFYDFVNDKIEFSNGLYVTYGQDIFLKKIK